MPARIGKWGEDKSYKSFILESRIITGAAAGNQTVTGIKPGDDLMTVIVLDDTPPQANLRDEFTIPSANVINNTGGTSLLNLKVLIQWVKAAKGMSGHS